MTAELAVRAWKDPHFRDSLSPAELSSLPLHPAGSINDIGQLPDVAGQHAGGAGLPPIVIETIVQTVKATVELFSIGVCPHTFVHGGCGFLTLGACPSDS